MEAPRLEELFVDLTEVFQRDLADRIQEIIVDRRRRVVWWRRVCSWFAGIRHLHCLCGPQGSACGCDHPPPSPVEPARIPVRTGSGAPAQLSQTGVVVLASPNRVTWV